ncbi:hypothetical protein [uncultured Oceanisphaera sp.]|uniref:hypothetical protein n=1 Tax=uncultured Oceanisphaera sp. TaxID=353858 RepID=UPI00262DAC59|nr:hypothetical protein [uncultured Oceanisphaera sp.]
MMFQSEFISFKVIALFFSVVMVPLASAQMYVPSPPIDPKSTEECHRHYERYQPTLKSLLDKNNQEHRGFLNKKGGLSHKEYQRAWRELSERNKRRSEQHHELLIRAGQERQECLNQVRAFNKSVRKIEKNEVANAARSKSAQLLTFNARRQAERYAGRKWRSAGIALHAKKQAERKVRQLGLAQQAWKLINGNGSWNERLNFVSNSTKQLNGLRPGGMLSKQLTAGSIDIITEHARSLVMQLNEAMDGFDRVPFSSASTAYVDVMRTASFVYDVKVGLTKSVDDIVQQADLASIEHPSSEINSLITSSFSAYSREQARIAAQKKSARSKQSKGNVGRARIVNKPSGRGGSVKCKQIIAQINEYRKAIRETEPYVDVSSAHRETNNLARMGVRSNRDWYNQNCR